MGWEENQLERTLYITKIGKDKYRLEQFMDVHHRLTSQDYREPIPSETMQLRHLVFKHVVIQEQHSLIKRTNAGQANLTNTNSAGLKARATA